MIIRLEKATLKQTIRRMNTPLKVELLKVGVRTRVEFSDRECIGYTLEIGRMTNNRSPPMNFDILGKRFLILEVIFFI